MSYTPKKGKCIDCGPSSQDQYLIAKRCKNHYWKHRAAIKAAERKSKPVDKDKLAQKKALDLWYANQIKQLPKCCENCQAPLIQFAPWAAKAYIAHVIPKRNFESVMIHPQNRLFLCIICHTNYDNWSIAKIKAMPVFGLAIERLLSFRQFIQPEELHYLPECFEEKIVI